MEEVRVRFAPSPTGYLHIGGARTALFNWLFAKKHNGKLVLRIEDTEGKAYYCFCTSEILEAEREKQRAAKQPFRYARTCRDLPVEEAKARAAKGEPYSVRIKIPTEGNLTVHDLIHGDVTFDLTQFDDFVIVKTNGMPTYNFAVVVDDHLMRISHVLRAEEHLSNTPKQVLLYEACGFAVPKFGHMPMILAPDRSKLSKRHGATSVEEFREQGYLPEAIVNYLTLLGWAPGNEEEIFSLQDTVAQFELEKMSKKAAVYDTKKLTWMNGQYLSALPLEAVLPEAKIFFIKSGLVDEAWLEANKDYFARLVDVVRVRVKTLQELLKPQNISLKR